VYHVPATIGRDQVAGLDAEGLALNRLQNIEHMFKKLEFITPTLMRVFKLFLQALSEGGGKKRQSERGLC
jgi:hypothetical protein